MQDTRVRVVHVLDLGVRDIHGQDVWEQDVHLWDVPVEDVFLRVHFVEQAAPADTVYTTNYCSSQNSLF